MLRAPPYPVPSDLPGTPYRLVELLGHGGFGAVYRASDPRLQHLPLAVKFCLDPDRTAALHRERRHLERLLQSAGEPGARHVVRLYGYDLDHPTPFLVYEFVPGGDLLRFLRRHLQATGAAPDPEQVLGWVRQIATGLALAHRHGLVHRDLKPANVLVDGDQLKLTDFGLGSREADVAGATSSLSLFRGAGTPLYMSPEQRRGEPPDPRHDLYSLGVLWFQMLLGDTDREMTPGWEGELAARPGGLPRGHVELIARCVGPVEERPADAGALLKDLLGRPGTAPRGGVVSCPVCGTRAMPHERTCKKCYHRLDGSGASPALDFAPPRRRPEAPDPTPACPACRAPFPDRIVVCLHCAYDRRTGTCPQAVDVPPLPAVEDDVPLVVAVYGFIYRLLFKGVAVVSVIVAVVGLLARPSSLSVLYALPGLAVALAMRGVGEGLELGRRRAVYVTAIVGSAVAAGCLALRYVASPVVSNALLGVSLLVFLPPVVFAAGRWRAFQ